MKYFYFLAILIFLSSCKEKNTAVEPPIVEPEITFISGADLSSLPEIEALGNVFYNSNGQAENMLSILKSNGMNTVRVRIWNHPANEHSGFAEVKAFSERLHAMGLKVWLTVHYSDHWADPGQQVPPVLWQGIPFEALKDSVYDFTQKIMLEIKPDYIQIGNEINPGFLLPAGSISDHETQFLELLAKGSQAVRDHSSTAKIMLHFAGFNGADWFYTKVKNIDYDLIVLSYYPFWHGKDMSVLQSKLANLTATFGKDLVIAETAYPFTLGWNDWTTNILGNEDQLILPAYPATTQGQQEFLAKLKEIVKATPRGFGFCYWGGELVAYKGPEATDASPWENQALFDFNNKALPVVSEFKVD